MNTLKLLYLLGQSGKSHSLFKENRSIFKAEPTESATPPTKGEKGKEETEAEQAGEQAVKEFTKTVGDLEKNPESLSKTLFTIDTDKGVASHYLSIHKGLKENVAKTVFPSSAILQEDLTTIINESYLNTTKVLPNFPGNADQGKILKVTFGAVKEGQKRLSFKCKALGKKDTVLYEFEVPIQPESLRKILEKKDAVKAEAIEKRKQEQTRALETAGWVEWSKDIPYEPRVEPKTFKYKREGNKLTRYRLFFDSDDKKQKIFIDELNPERPWKNIEKQSPEDFYKKNPTETVSEKARSQEVKAELTERAKTDKVKDSDKLKVTDASTARDEKDKDKQILTVKTFRRDEQYKETGKTTEDGKQIWQYSDKDEYYLDDGTRVTADGGKYEGSQKKSFIIGKYVTLTRTGTAAETKDEKTGIGTRDGTAEVKDGRRDTESTGSSFTRREAVGETQAKEEAARIEKALKHLKGEGMEIAVPEKLETFNIPEYSALKKANLEYKRIISGAKEVFTAIEDLRSLDSKLKATLKDSKISKLKLTFSPNVKTSIIWDKEGGFGEESKIIGALLRIEEERMKAKEITKDEYESFKELSKTRNIEIQGAREDTYRKEVSETFKDDKGKSYERKSYKESYKDLSAKLAEKQPSSDPRISDLSESKIVENWHHFGGTRTKAEYLMRQGPFSLTQERIPVAAAKIIKNGLAIKEISFEPIFNLAKEQGFKGVRTSSAEFQEGIPEGALDGSSSFQHAYSALANKENRTEVEEKRLQHMTDEVLFPCLELKAAMAKLIFEPEKVGERQSKKAPELTEDQKEVLKTLSLLFNFQDRDKSNWENFMASFFQDKRTGKITMANIDGTSFSVDQGTLSRHYSSKAALTILTNKPGLYKIENDKGVYRKNYDQKAMADEINRLTKLGLLQMVLQEQTDGKSEKNPPITEILASDKFKERLAKFRIGNLADVQSKFGNEQLKAFQLGFIVDQESRFSRQIEKGEEVLSENPAVRAIVRQLIKQSEGEISFEQGKEIAQKMLAMGVVGIDANGNFKGTALGIPIPLNDGSTLTLGFGLNSSKQANAGLALTVELIKANGYKVSITLGGGLTGVAAGVGATIEAGKINIGLFAGVAWSWERIIPTIGGSIDFSLNMDKKYGEKMTEAEGKDLGKLWKEWKTLSSIKEKYEALKKFKGIWAVVEAYQSNFSLEPDDIVHMIEGIQEAITAEVLEKLNFPLLAKAGIAMVGPIPVPYIGITLGSVVTFVPHRKEIAKILPEMSDFMVRAKIEDALKKLEDKTEQVKFKEQTSHLVYSKDGKLMYLEKKNEADFSGLNTSLEGYNKVLDKANTEMSLVQIAPGRIELLVNNQDLKDITIQPDEFLDDLEVVRDGGKIFLVGNITDSLILTRERYSLPFETTESGASMRDYITIRKKASVQGNRDRSFLEKYNTNSLRKLMEEDTFYIERGVNGNDGAGVGADGNVSGGIFEVAGFATKTNEQLSKEELKVLQGFMDNQSDFTGSLDEAGIQERQKNTERLHAVLEKKGMRMKESTYEEKEKANEEFFKKLGKLYKNKEFKTALGKAMGNGESIIDVLKDSKFTGLLKECGLEKLLDNEKQLTAAVTYLENAWFTKFYNKDLLKGRTWGEIPEQERKNINNQLFDSLRRRVKFVKNNVFIPEFEKALNRLGTHEDGKAKRLVDQLFSDLYENLLFVKLKDNPDFDFSKLEVNSIPGGAMFFSGSRRLAEKGTTKGALAKTISYMEIPKALDPASPVHDFGFLKMIEFDGKYPPDSEIGRVLLEISSPILEKDLEFLESPLAVKLLNSNILGFMVTPDDHNKITNILENPQALDDDAHKAALDRFRELIQKIREAQIKGKESEIPIPGKLTLRINSKAEITAGAYAKCTNPSFYVEETGNFEILNGQQVIGVYNEISETIEGEQGKRAVTIAGGVAIEKGTEPAERKGGKDPRKTPPSVSGTAGTPTGAAANAPHPTPGTPIQNFPGEGEATGAFD